MSVVRVKFLLFLFVSLLSVNATPVRAAGPYLWMTTTGGTLSYSTYSVSGTTGQVTAVNAPTTFVTNGLTGGLVLTTNDIIVASGTAIYRYSYTGALIDTIKSGFSAISGLAVSSDGKTLYVADTSANTLTSVNLLNGATVASTTVNLIRNVIVSTVNGTDTVYYTYRASGGGAQGAVGWASASLGSTGTLESAIATGGSAPAALSGNYDSVGGKQYLYYGNNTSINEINFTVTSGTPGTPSSVTTASGGWTGNNNEAGAASYPKGTVNGANPASANYQVVTASTTGFWSDVTNGSYVPQTGTNVNNTFTTAVYMQFDVTAKTSDPGMPEPGALGLTCALGCFIYVGLKRRGKVSNKPT